MVGKFGGILTELEISVFISGLSFKTGFSGLKKGQNRVSGFFGFGKSGLWKKVNDLGGKKSTVTKWNKVYGR